MRVELPIALNTLLSIWVIIIILNEIIFKLFSYDRHGCQGLENSIHPDEWNADAADYADTHGFEVSISDISFLSFLNITFGISFLV